jgi:hypothetical protein
LKCHPARKVEMTPLAADPPRAKRHHSDPQQVQKLLVAPVATSLKRLIPSFPSTMRKRLRQLPT